MISVKAITRKDFARSFFVRLYNEQEACAQYDENMQARRALSLCAAALNLYKTQPFLCRYRNVAQLFRHADGTEIPAFFVKFS